MVRRASTPRLTAGERRVRLERAAEALFADRGFLATTVDDIVVAAGVTKPVFYRHYESKQELVLTLLARHRDGLAMAALSVFTETPPADPSSNPDPVEWTAKMLGPWFDYLEANPVALQLLHSQSGDPVIDEALAQLHVHQRAADVNLLRPYANPPIPEDELQALGEAVRATLSALAHAVARGEVTRAAATAAITRLVRGALGGVASPD